jgi:hypothetical protein
MYGFGIVRQPPELSDSSRPRRLRSLRGRVACQPAEGAPYENDGAVRDGNLPSLAKYSSPEEASSSTRVRRR